MLNVDKLLKKKKWTGEELGRLELVNTLHVFSQTMQGDKKPKPLVNRADFRRMLNSITEPEQRMIYNGYIAIHEWFSTMYNLAIAQEQQAYLNLNVLINTMLNASVCEKICEYINELPAVLTDAQYKKLIEAKKEEIMPAENMQVNSETGHYKIPIPRGILTAISLESYLPNEKDHALKKSKVENARGTLVDSYYFLLGYNASLMIVDEMYNLDEIEVAMIKINRLEDHVATFNELSTQLYKTIESKNDTGDHFRQMKLNTLRDIFYPIDIKNIALPIEKIKQTKENMKDFKAFRHDRYNPLYTLCYRTSIELE